MIEESVQNFVVAHADKTVLKIGGITVKGLNTRQLEELLTERLQSVVRVIGVTGESIDMDVYGLDESDILRKEDGIITAVSLAEGITLTDLSKIISAKKIVPVHYDEIPEKLRGCGRERWHLFENGILITK